MSSGAINTSRAASLSLPFSLEPSWSHILADEIAKPYMQELLAFVDAERQHKTVYPSTVNVFRAFWETPFDKVKVVLLGQDPYHGPGQAHGLCFSVPKGVPIPPSLRNIFKELHDDLGVEAPKHGCLEAWAAQGVMLLNTTLTVREGEPLSHAKKGWESFTDAVLAKLTARTDPPIFVLWGKSAQHKWLPFAKLPGLHCLIAMHPSPLSAHRGFFGCRHFSKINQLLEQQGKTPINWLVQCTS
jgi:uracil-DNA glycosylase